VDVSTIALSVAGFVLAGAWREFHAFKREIQKWQAKIDTALFGAQGDNGLNGTTRDHEARIRVIENTCQIMHSERLHGGHHG